MLTIILGNNDKTSCVNGQPHTESHYSGKYKDKNKSGAGGAGGPSVPEILMPGFHYE